MGDMREIFDAYKEICKENHRQRVEKTPSRVLYAEEQLKAHGIKYEIKNPAIGHFHCWRRSDGKLIQFWAGTGKIMGYANLRGIHNLIKLCEKTTD